MIKRIQTGVVILIAVLFAVSLVQCDATHPNLHVGRASRWGEYGTILERRVGPLRYLGGMQVGLGGIDVYEAGDGTWWLVGPGRRFNQCTPATAAAESDRVLLEAAREREASLGNLP